MLIIKPPLRGLQFLFWIESSKYRYTSVIALDVPVSVGRCYATFKSIVSQIDTVLSFVTSAFDEDFITSLFGVTSDDVLAEIIAVVNSIISFFVDSSEDIENIRSLNHGFKNVHFSNVLLFSIDPHLSLCFIPSSKRYSIIITSNVHFF